MRRSGRRSASIEGMNRALRRRYGHAASGGVRAALVGYLHHVQSTKPAYQPPESLTSHVKRALRQNAAAQRKALLGIVHHDAGTRETYKLPRSLMRQVENALL